MRNSTSNTFSTMAGAAQGGSGCDEEDPLLFGKRRFPQGHFAVHGKRVLGISKKEENEGSVIQYEIYAIVEPYTSWLK